MNVQVSGTLGGAVRTDVTAILGGGPVVPPHLAGTVRDLQERFLFEDATRILIRNYWRLCDYSPNSRMWRRLNRKIWKFHDAMVKRWPGRPCERRRVQKVG